jgi:hypothetical protein
VRLLVRDFQNNVIFDETFSLTSVKTKAWTVIPVQVCDMSFGGCPPVDAILDLIPFTRRTFPGNINLVFRGDSLRRPTATANGTWWNAVVSDVDDLWIAAGKVSDEYYYGIVRGDAGGGGGIGGTAYEPGHGAASRTSALRADLQGKNVDTADEVVAHELGHNAGRMHIPSPAPACYNQPGDLDPNWPYGANQPYIQEVGFDVATGEAKVSDQHTDWQTYCTARWISPYTYNALMTAFLARHDLRRRVLARRRLSDGKHGRYGAHLPVRGRRIDRGGQRRLSHRGARRRPSCPLHPQFRSRPLAH